MAGGGRRSGDLVLGGRHLAGIFALLVVVLGIVFTLGYLLGRSRYEAPLVAEVSAAPAEGRKASEKGAGVAANPEVPSPPVEWDFYRSAEPARSPEPLAVPPRPEAKVEPKPASTPAQPPATPAAKPAPATPAKPATRTAAPGSALIPQGAITLQVAALLREADALALAQALQEKKFPAIVTTPSVDRYYRVQVGPYSDTKSATAARRELEKQGFKSIVRR
jgi:DedD protein